MILLDTHIWVWWVMGDPKLSPAHKTMLDAPSPEPLAISAFSCWEVMKLNEKARITLPLPVGPWLRQAIAYPRLQVLPVTAEVAVAVGELPPGMHRDPADQIIVATARLHGCRLLTVDGLILGYPHVNLYR